MALWYDFKQICAFIAYSDMNRYFEDNQVDIIILETGIGGKYDSTNFIESGTAVITNNKISDSNEHSGCQLPQKLVVVIASISMDHQALLGYTIEEICHQKCGIIKPYSHVFTASTQVSIVLHIIAETCVERNATLHIVHVDKGTNVLTENRLVGMQVVSYVRDSIFNNNPKEIVSDKHPGIQWWDDFFWPCRQEVFHLTEHDIVESQANKDTKEALTVVLDGCHNGDSVMKFMETMDKEYHKSSHCTLYTCVGIGVEKLDNIVTMLEYICQYSDYIFLMKSQHFKAMG